MIVRWPEKGTVSEYDCHAHSLTVSFVRRGDFVNYHGVFGKVITVQRNCESINRRGLPFTMVTLETRNGEVIPARDLFGKFQVLRGRKIS